MDSDPHSNAYKSTTVSARAYWICWIGLTIQALVLLGCSADSGPQPPGEWTGAKPAAPQISTTTSAVLNPSAISEFDVCGTQLAPERVIEVVRSVLEPQYGTMSYARKELGKGQRLHMVLTPRFDVGMAGVDYSWIQVDVHSNPTSGWSTVDVYEKRHIWRPFLLSAHGGLWPFPISGSTETRNEKDKQTLLTIMRQLDDPTAELGDRQHFQ